MLGLELVVFRGADSGAVSVLDAYCPHLGAHMGVGGQVVGDCMECPFHKWQFATGACAAAHAVAPRARTPRLGKDTASLTP
jgi:phenylpropionate dioxygenase-like ring-hydroxylating dioxygenase large terminal subunit